MPPRHDQVRTRQTESAAALEVLKREFEKLRNDSKKKPSKSQARASPSRCYDVHTAANNYKNALENLWSLTKAQDKQLASVVSKLGAKKADKSVKAQSAHSAAADTKPTDAGDKGVSSPRKIFLV